MNDFFSLRRFTEYFPAILARLPVTLSIVAVSLISGVLLGLLLAIIRINKLPILNTLAWFVVSFLRGTPIIVQLFIVYYGTPFLLKMIGINAARWSKFIFVSITYALNTSAFLSELIRSSINGVDTGQREAALSCGLSSWQAFYRIIAPQALLIALPGFSVMLLALIQNTSLGFSIGLVDVVGEVRAIGVRTYHYLEGYAGAALIFVVLSLIINQIIRAGEKRIQDKIRSPASRAR
ncbi:MAG: amino acid ABC transporter permease [Treponema sp.]|nr:amino acid ABC transporter permease [Treponema sp.]